MLTTLLQIKNRKKWRSTTRVWNISLTCFASSKTTWNLPALLFDFPWFSTKWACHFSILCSFTVSASFELICHHFFCRLNHFVGWDWANSDQQDVSLQPKIEHMVTSAQFAVITWSHDFLSPTRMKLFIFFSQLSKELWLHNQHYHNDINQSQSCCSPLKLHANLGLNEPHLCAIFVASSVIALIELTCVVTQRGMCLD